MEKNLGGIRGKEKEGERERRENWRLEEGRGNWSEGREGMKEGGKVKTGIKGRREEEIEMNEENEGRRDRRLIKGRE